MRVFEAANAPELGDMLLRVPFAVTSSTGTAPGGSVGDPRRAAGRIGSSEVVLDAAIGTRGQAVGRDQGAEHVADEPLERGSVGRHRRTCRRGGRSHR